MKQIPSKFEWAGYKDTEDVREAHRLFFGKSVSAAALIFARSPIERAHQLLYMPRKAFQYYVFAFAEYLRSDQAIGESDAASPFLRLLVAREERDPGSVMEIFEELSSAVEFVASNQERFDAYEDIYGSFKEIHAQLSTAYARYVAGKA